MRDEDNMLDCTHVTCVCVYVMGAGVLDKLVRSRLCERVCVCLIFMCMTMFHVLSKDMYWCL